MNNNTMSIYEAITTGLTVANSQSARVSEAKVSVDAFAQWKAAENVAYDVFYDYACELRKVSTMGEGATVNKTISDSAFVALQNLLNCIGEVNGFKIVKNREMLDAVAMTSTIVKKSLVGEALTQQSIVKNLKAEVDGFRAGMNEEYIRTKTMEYEQAQVKLSILKKDIGSCETKRTRATKNKFYIALENELALIINQQEMTPRAQLEAEDKKRKEERAAKRKANKLAKQSAK